MSKRITAVPRTEHYPFPTAGIAEDEKGIAYYEGLPESLTAVLRGHAETIPDAEAVAEAGGERLTYAQLYDRATRVAGGLRAAGLESGGRVALRYPAGMTWVLAFWGTLLAGGIPVAVNTRFTGGEVDYVLRDADVTVDLGPHTPLPDAAPFAVEAAPDDVAVLFYTSGTTGRPKGVPNTHRGILSVVESIVRCIGLGGGADDPVRTLISVPLFHVTGCNAQLVTAAVLGGTSVILPELNLGRVLELIEWEQINFLVTVPAVFTLLLRYPGLSAADVSSLRWIGFGGAPAPSSLPAGLRAAFPGVALVQAYGMTELSAVATVIPDDVITEHPGSVGYPVPTVDLAIEHTEGQDWGELLVRGPNVTTGYWHDQETTAKAEVDGWFRTGDIVRADEAGRIYLIDRAKDIIIRGGENVSSVEVENALAAAPGVAEAAVIGVPDDVLGEKVGAIVVPIAPVLNVAALLDHARAVLADYKVPQYLVVSDHPLPRTPAGKVRKPELRERTVWGAQLWTGTRSRRTEQN